MLTLDHVRRTSWAAVSQFEGRTADGRPVHVHYKWGELAVRVGPVGGSMDDALDATPIARIEHGDEHEFDIAWPEIAELTGITVAGAVVDPYARPENAV